MRPQPNRCCDQNRRQANSKHRPAKANGGGPEPRRSLASAGTKLQQTVAIGPTANQPRVLIDSQRHHRTSVSAYCINLRATPHRSNREQCHGKKYEGESAHDVRTPDNLAFQRSSKLDRISALLETDDHSAVQRPEVRKARSERLAGRLGATGVSAECNHSALTQVAP